MKDTKGRPNRNKKRNTAYCSPGSHNPLASHDESSCWNLHPELRPNQKGPSTQLVEVDSDEGSTATLLWTEPESRAIVLDTGASRHMINDEKLIKTTHACNLKISTGGHHNFLQSTAVGYCRQQPC
ncbi:hypothetical protein VP01_58g9 [Puccinia sorghi]|uniref:Uncharacterized protein n=1 Tax=Puccinia sorghi TaxID=27349 RepID=A0A0L6UHU2_9BASI|nr:hypothetical protein VP01_58g9 [Puccinia sorghi]